jgi:hypothetical protein
MFIMLARSWQVVAATFKVQLLLCLFETFPTLFDAIGCVDLGKQLIVHDDICLPFFFVIHFMGYSHNQLRPVAGVLDEPYSQLTQLSGVKPYRPASLHRQKLCPSYVAWRAGITTPLS